MSSSTQTLSGVRYRKAALEDGPTLWRLARDTRGLDLNSPYAYTLLGWMFGDSCCIAEDEEEGEPLGFVAAIRPPERPDSIFVWQVGVLPEARGRGVALGLLGAVVDGQERPPVRMEATVTPDNRASKALFSAFARKRGAELEETPLMSADDIAGEHQPEHLLTIGPI